MKNYLLVISALAILFFVGCFSSGKLTKQNIANLYLPKSKLKQPLVKYEFANKGNNIKLVFKLNSFNVNRNVAKFNAKLILNLYNNSKTATPIRQLVQPIEFNNLIANFTFEFTDAYDLISYTLESDNFTKPLTGFLPIDELNNNKLLISNKNESNKISYLIKNEKISFSYKNVVVKYFNTNKNIAIAPYLTDAERIIKQPELTANTTLNKTTFTPQQNGYYLFESNEKQKGILCVNKNFPTLNDLQTLALSLRYITKNEELKQIFLYDNLEAAIDSFWLAIGNNNARAQKLQQEYFLRLTTSNKHFSSVKPGWQTDRGMIYTIFGPPNEVYKTEAGENWYYSQLPIPFKFTKKVVLNNYNYYQLQRNENLALYWHQAVSKWRNGHIKSTEVLE